MTAHPISLAPHAPTAPLIRLLGPLSIKGSWCPTASKQRQTLALLALNRLKAEALAQLIGARPLPTEAP